jgi:hypothetical protein
MDKVLGHFDAGVIRQYIDEAEILSALAEKGFVEFEVTVGSAGYALPHTLLFGSKGGERFLLLDACVGEATVRPEFFRHREYVIERPIDLAVVHWVREEDPTAPFRADRPPLPLQRHPGLGVLRRAFRVITRMAAELGKDGIVSVPKFFHDAVIFYRSRLFLFLCGTEQGRFEALMRDLRHLSLRDASLALVAGCVHDAERAAVQWVPSYQVFPLSAVATAYFHSPQYASQVTAALNQCRFTCDATDLTRASAAATGA